MLKILQKAGWILGGAALLLLAQTTFAGAPEGHPDSIDSELRSTLMQIFDEQGYMRNSNAGQIFQHSISAYLWENRHQLTTTDIPNARQVDVLVCLLVKKGYRGLDKFAGDRWFMDWCDGIVIAP